MNSYRREKQKGEAYACVYNIKRKKTELLHIKANELRPGFAEVNPIIKIFIYEELTFIVPRTMDELLHTTSLLIVTISSGYMLLPPFCPWRKEEVKSSGESHAVTKPEQHHADPHCNLLPNESWNLDLVPSFQLVFTTVASGTSEIQGAHCKPSVDITATDSSIGIKHCVVHLSIQVQVWAPTPSHPIYGMYTHKTLPVGQTASSWSFNYPCIPGIKLAHCSLCSWNNSYEKFLAKLPLFES